MKCVWCEKDATHPVSSGLIAAEWYACSDHVSWLAPARMRRWWFYLSGALIAIPTGILIAVQRFS